MSLKEWLVFNETIISQKIIIFALSSAEQNNIISVYKLILREETVVSKCANLSTNNNERIPHVKQMFFTCKFYRTAGLVSFLCLMVNQRLFVI